MKSMRIFWMLIVLLLGSTTIMAQGRRNMPCGASGNRFGNGFGDGTCIAVLADLTEDQKSQIAELIQSHQQEMDKLRETMRATFDLDEKNKIRAEMLQKVQEHRNEVRSLLTASQQEQYDMLHARYGLGLQKFSEVRKPNRWQRGAGRMGGRGRW